MTHDCASERLSRMQSTSTVSDSTLLGHSMPESPCMCVPHTKAYVLPVLTVDDLAAF